MIWIQISVCIVFDCTLSLNHLGNLELKWKYLISPNVTEGIYEGINQEKIKFWEDQDREARVRLGQWSKNIERKQQQNILNYIKNGLQIKEHKFGLTGHLQSVSLNTFAKIACPVRMFWFCWCDGKDWLLCGKLYNKASRFTSFFMHFCYIRMTIIFTPKKWTIILSACWHPEEKSADRQHIEVPDRGLKWWDMLWVIKRFLSDISELMLNMHT